MSRTDLMTEGATSALHRRCAGAARCWIATVTAVFGCTTTLPPPRAPDRVVPRIRRDLGEPADGFGRVILDVVDGPAEVREVLSESSATSSAIAWNSRGVVGVAQGSSAEVQTRPVCTTPCVADLIRGTHTLVYTLLNDPRRTERAEVVAGTQTWVYRRAMGTPRRVVPATFGAGLAISIVGLGVELASVAVIGDDSRMGLGLVIGGAIVAIAGIAVMISNYTVQAPSVTDWSLDEPTEAPPGDAIAPQSTLPTPHPPRRPLRRNRPR